MRTNSSTRVQIVLAGQSPCSLDELTISELHCVAAPPAIRHAAGPDVAGTSVTTSGESLIMTALRTDHSIDCVVRQLPPPGYMCAIYWLGLGMEVRVL